MTMPVPGTAGKYVAGSDGHIYCFSAARVNARKPKPFRVAEFVGSTGYSCMAVIRDGRKTSVATHSLVARAFHGDPVSGHVVRHLSGDARDNRPENLQWGTYAQNEADKRRHGRVAEGERHGQVRLTDEGVRIIRAAIPAGLWDSTNAAKVFGVSPATINQIARGRGWKHVT